MRRVVPGYGLQGPDALLLFALLLALGLLGVVLRIFPLLSIVLLAFGAIGVFILFLVSSYSYRTNLRDRILELCGCKAFDLVLDVGTGRGLLAIGFAKLGCRAVGMDIWSSSDLLRNSPVQALLNAELAEVEVFYLTGDALRIPFRERSFNLVVCCDMIHNLHSRERARGAISEMHRVLREKGKVVIADLNPFLGAGWSVRRWRDELNRAGFERIGTGRFGLTSVIWGEKP